MNTFSSCKFLLLLLFLSGHCFTGLAQDTQNKQQILSNYPWADLAMDTLNMGHATTGDQMRGSLKITNLGEPDMVIARVRSSCGLMIATWPTNPIPKGETAEIVFRFDTNRPGRFNRNIIIHTNAWQKDIIIPVTGMVDLK